jgi:Calpain family cysteine protease
MTGVNIVDSRHAFDRSSRKLAAGLICMCFAGSAFASDASHSAHVPINDASIASGMRNAQNLYNQHQYASAAVAFESLIQSSSPNPTLYYYAALANSGCGKQARAKQLFQYLVTNFLGTQEASYAAKALSSAQGTATSKPQSGAQEAELPESVRNALPKEMQDLLKTDMGKMVVQQSMAEQTQNVQAIKRAEDNGILNKANAVAAIPKPAVAHQQRSGHPFTAEDIARDGASGIDQSRFPNCWFEASMSALARLPRGQRSLANMISYGSNNDYIVRFPNDGTEYVVSKETLKNNGIHDKALWASILECAELRKFPDNQGSNGADSDQSRLEIGLGCITGCKAEILSPKSCSEQELSAFIGAATKSQNPIVCATWGERQLASLPDLVVPSHAYTVIDLDPAKQLITMRNPHGRNSERFDMPQDPAHQSFEQLDDGVLKMSIGEFQKYFHSIARSFI